MNPKPQPATPTALMQRPAPLVAKLSAPSPTGHEISRHQICNRVLAAEAAKLVLFRAPAGFGKTTVMLEVRRELTKRGVHTAWLTLDRADNDVGRFLSVLAAAVQPLIPGLAQSDFQVGTAPDDIAFALIDQIAAFPAPIALFLDDFETLQSPAVLGLVKELIEQLPAGAKLIIGSRGVPEIGLGRLRGGGRLLEIEPAHLRFSVEETDRFMREQRHLNLASDDVVRLHRSTEGWAAALWLASISLEHRDDPGRFIAGFTGSNAAVVDYLVDDVLARQTEDIRNFLLRTSIVTDLNASLCNELTGRCDSFKVLGVLERAHLFLVPIQADRSRYRYHSMFAEFLRTQLKRQYPEEVPRLHMAAARWYEKERRPVPAIEHALAAPDLSFALPLLRRYAQGLLDQGRVRLLSRWLDPLLAQGHLDADPMLQVIHAWAVCLSRGPHDAAPLLDRLDRLADPDPVIRAHRQAMRPLFLVLCDRNDEAAPLAAELLAGVPSTVGFVQGFLEVVLANLAMIAGHYQEALRFADAARRRQQGNASSFNLALSEAVEGAVDLTQGRLRKAIAHLRLAVSAGTIDLSRATNGNAMAGVLLAEALYEADLCDQAERLLTVYIPLIRAVGIPDQLIIAHTVMARIALHRGDENHAQQLLAELEHIGHRGGLPRIVASARLERARMWAIADRLAQARAEINRSGDKALWARISKASLRANEVETRKLAMARWALRSGHASDVIPALRSELDAAEWAQRERRALTLRLVLAQAYHRDGQSNKAMRVLAKAIRFAAAEGYVRALLDEGPLLLGMLHQLRDVPNLLEEDAGAGGLMAFVDRLLGGQRTPPEAPPATPPKAVAAQSAGTHEALTKKEIHVLRLTAEGLSNMEVAERLFVAQTTVRTHLRNINVKLGVRNRMEAIAVARKAGLLA